MKKGIAFAALAIVVLSLSGCRTMGCGGRWWSMNDECGNWYGGSPYYGGTVIDGGLYVPKSGTLERPPLPGPEGT